MGGAFCQRRYPWHHRLLLHQTGIAGNSRHVVNTGKAFDFIGDHVGHLPFIIVAIGTIAYGLFMFGFGIYYDSDLD